MVFCSIVDVRIFILILGFSKLCLTTLPREEEMATHSTILAWRILWTEEPGGL